MDYLEELKGYIKGTKVEPLFIKVEPMLMGTPGGAAFHHNFEGGLVRHIVEMIIYGTSYVGALSHLDTPEGERLISTEEYINVCFLHDIAKLFFYKKEADGVFSYVKHPFILQEMVVMVMCAEHGIVLTESEMNALWLAEGAYSPVFGKIEATPLANLLHMADMFSSQLLNPKMVVEGKCPQCGEGVLVKRTNGTSGNIFWACNRYPECKYTQAGTPKFLMVENTLVKE